MLPSRKNGKAKQSDSRTLLDALAAAIDGTDVGEITRLAAEFNSSFGELVRASVGPESEVAPEERLPATNKQYDPHGDWHNTSSLSKTKEAVRNGGSTEIPREERRRGSMQDVDPEIPEVTETLSVKRRTRDPVSSSDDSSVPKPKKKKSKRKTQKKKTDPPSDSSSDSSSVLSSTSSDSEDAEDSDDEEQAELCYDVTNFESADLPDLPDRWDKGFRKLRSYVPLSLFKASVIESYHEDDTSRKSKEKLESSKNALKALEKQLTYGDFIEMCDLEERYAREIYGLETYADYVVQHKKIVSDLKKTYNCWMIGLRYHLKVRTVIFRRRKLIKTRVKGKTVLKDKVKIPNGLQTQVESQARHDADRAGDLQFVDNPYAVGGPKYGFDFATGRQPAPTVTSTLKEKTVEPSAPAPGYRGNRAGSGKRPYGRKPNYGFQRFPRNAAGQYNS